MTAGSADAAAAAAGDHEGWRSPPGFQSTSPSRQVRPPGEDEQQVREPVEVVGGERVHRVAVGRQGGPGAALGPADDGPGGVQQRRPGRAAGQDEAAQRRQVRVLLVAGVLQGAHVAVVDPQRGVGRVVGDRVAQVRTDVEQLVLDPGEQRGDVVAELGRARARPRSRSWPRPRRRRRPAAGRSWAPGSCRRARWSRRRRCGCRYGTERWAGPGGSLAWHHGSGWAGAPAAGGSARRRGRTRR